MFVLKRTHTNNTSDSFNKYNILSKFRFCCDFRYLKYEEFDDTKEVIIIRILKKDRQHNGQKKKYKGQTTIYKAGT